jgi:hypothetical protein
VAALGVPIVATMVVMSLPMDAISRQNVREVNNVLLDSDVSYTNFLAKLVKPDPETSKGSYSANIYWPTEGFAKSDHHYEVGFRNGRLLWVAYKDIEVLRKIVGYRNARGLR